MVDDGKAQAKQLLDYLANKTILVADPSSGSRATVASVLIALGVKSQQIKLMSTFSDAVEEIERAGANVVVAEYHLGKRCGLDLLPAQRAKIPDPSQTIFILITSNTAQIAVAKAAEEDVDHYIIKPFTAEILKKSIMRTALSKVRPSEYKRTIDQGKQELGARNYEEALKIFERAGTLDPAPALALYYVGKTQEQLRDIEGAERSYLAGLEYNNIHYKCLIGLYENLYARKKYAEAYEVIKKVTQNFPANSNRLTAVLRLAVMTRNYTDVEDYYNMFTAIDERNEEMIKYVCAALIICAKHCFQQDAVGRAVELLQKAAITAGGRTKTLREIILVLMGQGKVKEAEEVLKRFQPQTHSGVDYAAVNLLIADATAPKAIIVEKGRNLLAKDLHDPLIYQLLITRSHEAGLKAAAEDLVQKAIEKFPEKKEIFEKALEIAPRQATEESQKLE